MKLIYMELSLHGCSPIPTFNLKYSLKNGSGITLDHKSYAKCQSCLKAKETDGEPKKSAIQIWAQKQATIFQPHIHLCNIVIFLNKAVVRVAEITYVEVIGTLKHYHHHSLLQVCTFVCKHISWMTALVRQQLLKPWSFPSSFDHRKFWFKIILKTWWEAWKCRKIGSW